MADTGARHREHVLDVLLGEQRGSGGDPADQGDMGHAGRPLGLARAGRQVRVGGGRHGAGVGQSLRIRCQGVGARAVRVLVEEPFADLKRTRSVFGRLKTSTRLLDLLDVQDGQCVLNLGAGRAGTRRGWPTGWGMRPSPPPARTPPCAGATVKKLRRAEDDTVWLMPCNVAFPPICLVGEGVILGKVVAVLRSL